MKSIAQGLFVALLAIAVGSAAGVLIGRSELAEAFGDPEQPWYVVRVSAETGRQMLGDREFRIDFDNGTGSLIQEDLILTANHVVRGLGTRILDKDAVQVEFADGTVRAATVIKHDALWDLALLQIEPVEVEPVPLAAAAAARGESVTIQGFPFNKDYKEVTGNVSGFEAPSPKDRDNIFVVNDKAFSGMSGGPAVRGGEQVGVLFGTLGRARCTGLQAITAFLEGTPYAQND